MNRAVGCLCVLPIAVCIAVACGCSEPSSVQAPPPAAEPADVVPAPPLPPPPAPDMSGLVVDEPAEQTPADPDLEIDPDLREIDPDLRDVDPDLREFDEPSADAPLTVQQARTAIQDLGGRVAVDDSGSIVKVFLNRTEADDERIRAVEFLPNIEILNLTGTSITDAGLDHLRTLKKLRHLYMAKTDVTDQGLDKLQEVLPDCKVYR